MRPVLSHHLQPRPGTIRAGCVFACPERVEGYVGGAVISVANLNATFPKYPKTVEDKGWIYGVWYCGTHWHKASLYGQYPPTFLKRALALFPGATEILHCPSGTVTGPGLTVDLIHDGIRVPHIIADAKALPFRDESFELILSDPPYSDEDAKKHGCRPFPLNRFCKEALRVLRPGGYLGILHVMMPSYRRKDWTPRALIAVVTGWCKKTRMFTIMEKPDLAKRFRDDAPLFAEVEIMDQEVVKT